jgi:superfamily II DNA or RNA helicase
MPLRPYQEKLFLAVREAFRGRRSVLMQLATGGGKTFIFAEMSKSAQKHDQTVWILVPRNELLNQASEHLAAVGVVHGRIDAKHQESTAFNVQIVSKNTLIRRYGKIKRPPTFVIVDEAHLALERYMDIADRYPEAKILGVTATPERLDGRGLSDLYETMVMGPSIKDLVELGYLSDVRYFQPPTEGIENLHRRGTDYSEDELEALLESRKIYGKTIKHYRKHADGKPCIVFCRSVKLAEDTAARFREAGYRFESIDGKMTNKKRKSLLDGLESGKLHGLTSVDLITYGLDCPVIKCIIMLRPTLSRALYSQMIGRGLRPTKDGEKCVIIDHVNNLAEHSHPLADYDWAFYGREKRKPNKDKQETILRLCPEIDYMYCEKRSCVGCVHNKSGRTERKLEVVDVDLVEAKPVKLGDRPREEKKEFVDRINAAIMKFESEGVKSGAVGDLLKVAKELGYTEMWTYYRLNKNKHMVNRPLLHEIGRELGRKPGWAYFAAKRMKERG